MPDQKLLLALQITTLQYDVSKIFLMSADQEISPSSKTKTLVASVYKFMRVNTQRRNITLICNSVIKGINISVPMS